MKTTEISLALAALFLAPLAWGNNPCPCPGDTPYAGTDGCGNDVCDAVDVDTYPYVDACGNGVCEEPEEGMECCGNETYSPSWKGVVSNSFTADPALVGKINSAVNKIPMVNVNLTSAKGTASGDKKDCCLSDELQSDGIGYAQGSLTVSGNLKGLKIFGPPTVDRRYDFTVVEVEIEFEVGASLNADLSVGGTGGSRWDDCNNEACNYGSFDVNATLGAVATIDILACVETWFTSKKCIDIQATVADVSVGVSGSITSGDKDTCLDSVSGTVDISDVEYSATFRVAEYEITYTRSIYPVS